MQCSEVQCSAVQCSILECPCVVHQLDRLLADTGGTTETLTGRTEQCSVVPGSVVQGSVVQNSAVHCTVVQGSAV